MIAAWDWDLPRETSSQQRDLVEFAADCGFDTLVVRDPTEAMVEVGEERGVRLVAVIDARPDETFRDAHPECLQRIHPVEDAILEAVDTHGPTDLDYWHLAHRQYPQVHDTEFLCLEREASLEYLEEQVREALEISDGVAFDGFGYRNHYACFCEVCERTRARRAAESQRDGHGGRKTEHDYSLENLQAHSEETLVSASKRLSEHATSVMPSALVTNHVWPPFAPNPSYGHRLHLEYCTQTVSWFYRPVWSLERVEFEAAEHARLARQSEVNTFVPFIGLFDDPYHRRTGERVKRELEIGLEYGDENVVLCTLGLLREDPSVEAAVRDALR